MKLLLLNSDRFVSAFRKLGHEVVTAGCKPALDIVMHPDEYTLANIRRQLPFTPDAIIVELWSDHAFVTDLTEAECPLIAYIIDSTLNRYWIRDYGHVFDRILVDHFADIPVYRKHGLDAHWLPLSVNASRLPDLKPNRSYDHDIVFVGRIQPFRKKRQWLLDLLSDHFTVHIAGGDGKDYLRPREMYELFSRSRIILNENLFDGWTMRMIEGAGCGSLLFSETVSPENGALLRNHEHLAFFTPDNVLEEAHFFLDQDAEREQIAAHGRDEVLANHTHLQRANAILAHIHECDTARRLRVPQAVRDAHAAKAFRLVMLRWPLLAKQLGAFAETAARTGLAQGILVDEMSLLLGRLIGQWSDHVAEATSLLEQAFHENPDNIETRLALYEIYTRAGKHQAALHILYPVFSGPEHASSERTTWMTIADFLVQQDRKSFRGYVPTIEDRFPVTAEQYYYRARETGDPLARWQLTELTAEMGNESNAYVDILPLMGKYDFTADQVRQMAAWARASYRPDEATKLETVSRQLGDV